MNTSPPGCGFPQALNSYVWVIMNNPKQQSIFKAPPTSPPVCGGGGGGWMMWPPRSYPCNFCKRDFRSAQALGGHMNVHRRDRALLKQEDHLLRHTTTTLNPSHHEDHHHHLNSTIGGHHVSTHRHLNPSLANKSTTVCNSSKKGGICHALAARTRVLTGSSSRQMGFVSSSKCNSTTSSCSPTLRNYRRLSKLSCGCKGSEIVHQTKLSNKGFISCTPWKLIKGGGNDAAAAFNTKRHKKNQGGFNDLVSSSWPPLDSNKGSCNSVTKCVTTLHEPEDNLLDLELRLGDRGTNN